MGGLPEKIARMIDEEGIEFIELFYVDMSGILRSIVTPVSYGRKVFQKGIGIDGSSVIGFRSVESGDMVVRPDIETAFIDPFADAKTLAFFGEIWYAGENKRFEQDPRFVLKQAQELVSKRLGVSALFLPELEFYLFNDVEFSCSPTESYFYLYSEEADGGYVNPAKRGYHIAMPFDRFHNLRSEIVQVLEDIGIPVKYHHHEVGALSQEEVELTFREPLRCADEVVLAKYVIRNIAYMDGLTATFMPKPLEGKPGSGLHFHQYLQKDGVSVFWSDDDELHLSREGRGYIGGILKHSPALCALTNPSTNSYKRLLPGFEAPTRIAYSVANRTAAVRIPGYISTPDEMRIEYRTPDATANPYLAIAGMLLAGYDGIVNNIDPGPPVFANIEGIDAEIPSMPPSLSEAISALRVDKAFLTRDGVFTEEMIEKWIRIKEDEAHYILSKPHPYEFILYYGI